MKWHYFLLKCFLCFLFFVSCEKQEEGIVGITREETTTKIEFLQIDQQTALEDILGDNSLENPWKIVTATSGENDFTANFSETKFVFEITVPVSSTPEGLVSEIIIGFFEPGDRFSSGSGPISIFKNPNNNDLIFPLAITTSSGQERFDPFNSPIENIGYNILKDITSAKVTLVGTATTGEKLKIVFEKEPNIVEPPVETEFLQIAQLQDLKDILLDKEQDEAWKITSLTTGETQITDFENTKFEFFGTNQNNNVLDLGVFEPEDQQNQIPSLASEGTFTFSKDIENNDLRLVIDIDTNFNELEKFITLINLGGELGYRVKSDISPNKISLEGVGQNGNVNVLIFEKL